MRCADATLYTGVATDIARRCKQHNDGKALALHPVPVSGAAGLSGDASRSGFALRREAAIKALSRQEVALIREGRREAS